MLFNIAPTNAEKAKKCFTTTPNPHALPGYKKSAILKPKSRRASYVYEVNIIDNTCIVCTVRHEETETTEAVVKFSGYTPEQIEIERAELFRNCSNYPYRTETSARYFKKYDQIACIVHGAITAGLLFDIEKPEPVKAADVPTPETAGDTTTPTEEPETAPQNVETPAADETPTTPERDAQRAAESAEKTTIAQTDAATDKEPPRATERATTPAADHITPKTDAATPPEPPQETPQAPPRHETTASHTNTHKHGKSPPRGEKQPQTPRTEKTLINTVFPDFRPKTDSKTGSKILVREKNTENSFLGEKKYRPKKRDPRGVSKKSALKFFSKIERRKI